MLKKRLYRNPVVVIGSGLAGLLCANFLAEKFPVLVLTKQGLEHTNSHRSQGGIAAVWDQKDSVGLHQEDTLKTGCGLCDPDAVEVLAKEGKKAIETLIEIGVRFDKNQDGTYSLGLEGAHSLPRILHAGGDQTGAEIQRALITMALQHPRIEIVEQAHVVEIQTKDGFVQGITYSDGQTDLKNIPTDQVILASGGAGQVFRYTSNTPAATGDGLALAFMAGAWLEDLEFYQFHPTALCPSDKPAFLISEALRGEGGILRNETGAAFMASHHPKKDLAPRDVVSRAILHEIAQSEGERVFLDATHLKAGFVEKRFPGIFKTCAEFGLDIRKDPIPVMPVAHYMIGGVKTDLWGRTTVGGLYAVGEIARTGVHGANRLASNSLLEAAVFSIRASRALAADQADPKKSWPNPSRLPMQIPQQDFEPYESFDLAQDSFRNMMWEKAGLIRNEASLKSALEHLSTAPLFYQGEFSAKKFELYCMQLVARLMVESALQRRESRGCHFRDDFPVVRDEYRFSFSNSIVHYYQNQYSIDQNYGRTPY